MWCTYIDSVSEFSSLLEWRSVEFDFEALLLEVSVWLNVELWSTCSSVLCLLVRGRWSDRCVVDVIVALRRWFLDRVPSLHVESLRSVTST